MSPLGDGPETPLAARERPEALRGPAGALDCLLTGSARPLLPPTPEASCRPAGLCPSCSPGWAPPRNAAGALPAPLQPDGAQSPTGNRTLQVWSLPSDSWEFLIYLNYFFLLLGKKKKKKGTKATAQVRARFSRVPSSGENLLLQLPNPARRASPQGQGDLRTRPRPRLFLSTCSPPLLSALPAPFTLSASPNLSSFPIALPLCLYLRLFRHLDWGLATCSLASVSWSASLVICWCPGPRKKSGLQV